jgi:hypothetical protein
LPKTWVPFGWIDPEASSNIIVGVGNSFNNAGTRKITAKVDLMTLKEALRIPDGSGRSNYQGELLLQVESVESGRVLRISRIENPRNTTDREIFEKRNFQSSILKFKIRSLSLSVVVESPKRREVLSLYAEDLEGRVIVSKELTSYEFYLFDLQVDNYSEAAIFPVLLYNSEKEQKKRRTSSLVVAEQIDRVPLFQFVLVRESTRGNGPTSIKYLAVRLLELTLKVDSGTVKLIFSDLLSTLSYVSSADSLAIIKPALWIEKLNRRLLNPDSRLRKVDVYHAKIVATASKIYFENLIIHPMKLRLTFIHTPSSRDSSLSISSTVMEILTSLAEVDSMKIKINSFIVESALVSQSSLYNRLIAKIMQDLQQQLGSIAGSLTAIGSPLGLARKIGGGVKAFFYEPYMGAGMSV